MAQAQVHLTAAHWTFLFFVVVILVSIGFRRGVVIPSIVGIFVLALVSSPGGGVTLGDLIYAVQVVFKALVNSGTKLFDIMLIIALMVAMLRSLQAQGADQIMVAPLKRLMTGPRSAFIVLVITMYIAAAFFWPTPAVALVGTVLIPVAMRVGLPALAAAVAVNLSGHGTALSADPIIQGATRLSAGASGLAPGELFPYTLLFSLVAGGVAITTAGYAIRRDMRRGVLPTPTPDQIDAIAATSDGKLVEMNASRCARLLATTVPIVLVSIVALMIYRAVFTPHRAIVGSAATALLGGTATILLVVSTIAAQGFHAMDGIVTYTREGLVFATKIFAPIIPIAGLFFLGNPEHAAAVMGPGTPGFLFDVGNYLGSHLGSNVVLLSFGMTAIGVLIALDGSGFAGLPLTGSLAAALGSATGVHVTVLASLGQVATIVAGSGTLVAWSMGASAVAGIAGVSPAQLVRRNFVPVAAGLITITVLAAFMAR